MTDSWHLTPDRLRHVLRTLIVLVLLIAVSACAAPNYSAVIKTFSDATSDAQIALKNLDDSVSQEYETFLKDRVLATPGSNLARVDTECRTREGRCRLEILSSDPDLNGELFSPEPVLDDLVALMAHISAYARNLEALAKDQSAEEARSNVNAALGNIENLAKTLASKQEGNEPANIPAFSAPVRNLTQIRLPC